MEGGVRVSCRLTTLTSAPPSADTWQSRCQAAAKPITAFLEGLVVYTLSQQWDDLMSIYMFRLHSFPYCGSSHVIGNATHDAPSCTAEAPASRQLLYVAVLLVLSALVQCYAEIGPLPMRWHAWRVSSFPFVPRMIGMCIGWALGNLCKTAFLHIETQQRGLVANQCTSVCNLRNIAYCAALTLGTAVAMRVSQPIAAGHVSSICGGHSYWQLALAHYLRVLVLLLVNGLAVMVKIAWTFSAKGFLTWGVSSAQQGTVLFERALILWALSLTTTFAFFTLEVRKWRDAFEAEAAEAEAAARAAEAEAEEAEAEVAEAEAASLPHSPPTQRDSAVSALGKVFRRSGGRVLGGWVSASAHRGRRWSLALRAQCCELLESTMGWTTGCAWTDALIAYTPLAVNTIEQPAVALQDMAVAAAFTCLGCCWLLLSGQGRTASSGSGGALTRPNEERSHVEAAFATNAFIFFVGWSWVVVLRDGTALVFLGAEVLGASASARMTGVVHRHTRAHEVAGKVALLAEGLCTFMLGPVLTVAVLWAHGKVRPLEVLERRLTGRSSEDGVRRENPLFLL